MWTTKVKIAYSSDGKEWKNIINLNPLEGDKTKTLFKANNDTDTIISIELPKVSEYPFMV